MNNTAEEIVSIDSYDPNNIPNAQKKESAFVTKIPGIENPLIVKFLPYYERDSSGKLTPAKYKAVRYFKHLVGDNPDTDIRSHVDQEFLGEKSSPENNKYWEARNELKALKKDPSFKEDSPESRRLNALIATFKPTENGWLYYIEPNSATIKCLKLSPGLKNSLFGREAFANVPAIPSVIDEMTAKNRSPYNLKIKNGWMKIYKTGDGLNTRYVAEEAEYTKTLKIEGGGEVQAKVPHEDSVHEKFTQNLVLSDFPNPVEFERKYAFTYQEALAFAGSNGIDVPARFLNRNQKSEDDESVEVSSTGVVDTSEIPF